MARGDHVFYYRHGTIYSHHGIDTGEGTVVHYDSSLWEKLMPAETVPTVRESTWSDFAEGQLVSVRSYGGTWEPAADPPEQVVLRARSRLGEAAYDVLTNNCEHFAVWCKTGIAVSSQAAAVRTAARDWADDQWLTWALLRSARRIPPSYRSWAVGGTIAMAGLSLAAHYARQRWSQVRRGVS